MAFHLEEWRGEFCAGGGGTGKVGGLPRLFCLPAHFHQPLMQVTKKRSVTADAIRERFTRLAAGNQANGLQRTGTDRRVLPYSHPGLLLVPYSHHATPHPPTPPTPFSPAVVRYTDGSSKIVDATEFATMLSRWPPSEPGLAAMQCYVQCAGSSGTVCHWSPPASSRAFPFSSHPAHA